MTKIVKFLKPYMGATVAALFFSLFNNLMQLILPAMMALMINTGIGDGRMGTVQLIGGALRYRDRRGNRGQLLFFKGLRLLRSVASPRAVRQGRVAEPVRY